MRCLALAGALAARGAKSTFVSALLPDPLADRIRAAGHAVRTIEPAGELRAEGSGWESALLPPEAQRADAERTIAAAGEADWVVLDHYRLDANWAESIAGGARKLAIDDLANRRQACDLLVDQTFGRSPGDYAGLVGAGAKILAGSTFALLRPEFSARRPAALARREAPAAPRRLLISLGQTDAGGATARVLEAVIADFGDLDIDVAIGAAAGSRPRIEALAATRPQIRLHVDAADMAGLIARADLAVGAAGVTASERCCLGLPSVTLVLAANQRLLAANLERAGAVLVAADETQVADGLRRLCGDERLRMGMIAAAAAVTDGLGAQRVADAMLGPGAQRQADLRIRPAAASDSRAVWLWRNDPATRAASQTCAPVAWPDHAGWWARALASPDREILIAEAGGEPAAMVRFDRCPAPDEGFEVSINLRPDARGGGLGAAVLEAACQHFLARRGGIRLVATIHRDNLASRRVFERVGFVRETGLGETGFERYSRGEERKRAPQG